MNTDILFKTEEERLATEKVLAAFKVKSINKNIDVLVEDVLKYAKELDDMLETINLPKRYLEKVSALSEGELISLDDDLKGLDFKVLEKIEDLIKRINTRINLIVTSDETLKDIEDKYDVDNIDIDKEIELARLKIDDIK